MAGPLQSDGANVFLGGQDGSQTPDRIADGSYAAGVNVLTKQGVVSPRFRYRKIGLTFPEGGVEFRPGQFKAYADVFREGRFQSHIKYAIGNRYYQIVIIAGIIFLIDILTEKVKVIKTTLSIKLREQAPRVNFSQADRFLVLFNFPRKSLIVENSAAREADTFENEVPISVLGCYNENRLFIANAGNQLTAGDPVGDSEAPDAPITFNEISTGGAFVGEIYSIPSEDDKTPITGIAFLQAQDTSTGIGTMLVGTRSAVYSYATAQPRVNWRNGVFGTQVVSEGGFAGPLSFTNVNGDFFYTSPDGGVRSLSQSREEQQTWSKSPMSKEVEKYLNLVDPDLNYYVAMGNFKNHIFITANPCRCNCVNNDGSKGLDVAFGGFVVLSSEQIAKLGKSESGPAWEGLWTGIRPMSMIRVNDRCFSVSKDGFTENVLYEVLDERGPDTAPGGLQRQIPVTLYTKQHAFQNDRVLKEAHSADLEFQEVEGALNAEVRYKPSHGSKWALWQNYSYESPMCMDPQVPETAAGTVSQQPRDANLGRPKENPCDPVNQQQYTFFKKMQLRIKITADYFQLHSYLINAYLKSVDITKADTCKKLKYQPQIQECNSDWYVEDFNGSNRCC